MPRLISRILAVLLSGIAAVSTAMACGGVKAFIVDELPTTGARQVQGPNKLTFYADTAGHALLPASAVKVNSALAEAIARRYLTQFQGSSDSIGNTSLPSHCIMTIWVTPCGSATIPIWWPSSSDRSQDIQGSTMRCG